MKSITTYISEKLIIKKENKINKDINPKYLGLSKAVLNSYNKYNSENRSTRNERKIINQALTDWLEDSGVFPNENQIYEIKIDKIWSFCIYNTPDLVGVTYIKHIESEKTPLYPYQTSCYLKKSNNDKDYIPSIIHKFVSAKHNSYYAAFTYDYDDISTALNKFELYNKYEVYSWDIDSMIR